MNLVKVDLEVKRGRRNEEEIWGRQVLRPASIRFIRYKRKKKTFYFHQLFFLLFLFIQRLERLLASIGRNLMIHNRGNIPYVF